MALIWMDGFDTYGVHTGSIGTDANAMSVMASSGYVQAQNLGLSNLTRTGRGLCVRMANGAASYQAAHLVRAFDTIDEVIVGFAINAPRGNLTELCWIDYDNRVGTVRRQLGVYLNAQGGVTVVRGSGTTDTVFFDASGPNIMFPNVWHYVEVKYKPGFHCVVRVDGVTVLSTEGGYNPNAPQLVNLFRFANAIFNLDDYIKFVDDLYICDTRGGVYNDFCGDVVVHAVMPYADAGPNDMAVFGGGLSHASAISDIPPDNDVSYLYSNTVGHVDMFDVDQLPANIIDVLAVSVHARVKKDAAGTSMLKVKSRYDSDTVDSPAMPLTTQYSAKHFIFESAPDDGAWNRVKANNMQIGVEIV